MNGPEYTAIRLSLGMTVKELAFALGVQAATIYYRESGEKEIKREHSLALIGLAKPAIPEARYLQTVPLEGGGKVALFWHETDGMIAKLIHQN